MSKFDRFCQSCGMPMDQDPNHGGTNADGSKSTKYCSYCLVNGQFADGFKTSAEMVAFVRGKLKEMGYGWLKRWFYSLHISQLERWKNPV
ncbi:MAG: zinc ribbon domain-containing protein [Haliscomenobacter sp.]|nr:zinc ribbon domain-containing protein [Haliscomenobacter sp.]MBK7477146.1 zinc ribbon domain-containing protein [Haliscomenobacter sp.]MBK8878640.1 zinc ribbon domain-containing protein [Haliscomenobacter sp.]